ncbi:MAG: thiamine pyrophosphate-requiring protein [Chloroflexi bacterium]|nr:thiamine pyrophosphate-requiring protein [Chloroflexota bacterium]
MARAVNTTGTNKTMAEEWLPVDTGAEAFVELLNANNVDCIFLNPGTDTTPVQEALAKLKALGRRTPRVILCLDEYVAMSAAHGYFMVTGKPQVVLVHVDLGTQQVGGSLHNAQRSRIGVVLCAGRPPSIFGDKGGEARSGAIMWWQEQFDQPGIVRNYVKWEYELRSNEDAPHIVQRAFQVASNQPCGPVYLVLPRGVLTEKIEKVQVLDAARYSAASTPQADIALLTKAAEILAQAQNPLIMTGDSGRNPESVLSLVELAETLGARVSANASRLNFPTTHPLHTSAEATSHLSRADVVLIIDYDIPYLPARFTPGPNCKIIQIDIDPVKDRLAMWGFPTDILLHADSSKAIPVLTQLIRQRITPYQRSRIQARFQQVKSEKEQAQTKSRDLLAAKVRQTPIAPEWLSHCVAGVIDEDTMILNETQTSGGMQHIPRTKPGTLFGIGASSLGWALGASLGAKLAAPDRTIVTLIADGSFVFGCPTAALWAANVYHLPFLCVIFNNEGYNTVRRNLRTTFGKDNFGEKDGFFAGLDIAPSPNYAMLARSSNAYGEIVRDPSNVKRALRRALKQVHSGRAAVLDVRIAKT